MGIVDKARREANQKNQKASDMTWDGSRGWNVVRGTETEDLPDAFEDYTIEAFRRNPVVAACVREIQTSLSEAPIKVSRKEGSDFVEIPDHPLEDLFQNPNRRDSYVTFIERSAQHFLLGGNSFWRKRRERGTTTELLPIRPDRVVSADADMDGFPISFTIRVDENTSQTETIPFDDIVHIPEADPLNEVFGLPRVMAATLEIATDNEASNYVNEVLGNYGSPGTVVTINAERAKRQMLERAEALWQEKFGPGRGRGKVAFVPGGEQVQQIGFSLKDLEFEALRQVTRESICAAFGIDPMVVNITTAGRGGTMSGNEHKEARRKLWVQTLIPMIRRWEAAINAFLAPEFGDVVAQFDLTDVKALQEDRDNIVDRARKMVQSGATMEEARAEMGLDPDPPADQHFVLARNTDVISVSRFTEDGMVRDEITDGSDGDDDEPNDESDDDGGDGDSGKAVEPEEGKPMPDPRDDESEDAFMDRCMSDDVMVEDFPDEDQRFAVCQDLWDDGKALTLLKENLKQWDEKYPIKEKGPLSPGVGFTPEGSFVRQDNQDDAELAWKRFNEFARAQEPSYRLALEDIYEIERRTILRLALNTFEEDTRSGSGPQETKQVDPDTVEEFQQEVDERFDQWDDEVERRMRPLYEQTADSVSSRVAGALGAVGVTVAAADPVLQALIDDRIEMLVQMNRRTRDAVTEAVESGVREGLDRLGLVRRIENALDEGITWRRPDGQRVQIMGIRQRARMIAQTETTEMANGSAFAMIQSTGITWFKRWLSMRDSKVRVTHEQEDDDSHSDPVPLNDGFRITGRMYPGGFNCRCTITFTQPDEDAQVG